MKSIAVYLTIVLAIVFLVPSTGWAAAGFVEKGIYGAYQNTDQVGDGLGAGIKLTLDAKKVLPAKYDLIGGVDIRGNWTGNYRDDRQLFSLECIYTIGLDMHKGLKPYIGVGAGGYIWHSDADEKHYEADDTLAGNVVFGIEKRVRESTAFFAEGKYLYGDSALEGFGANIGVNWLW